MWGEFADQTNGKGNDDLALLWHIGEDSPDGAFRNMIQPTNSGQPDMMTSSLYYTGTLDNGGIHTNSGVGNKAAAFLVDGGYFNNVSVTGIGSAKASAIYYEAQTNLLVSGSDYQDLHHILYQACMNILGNTDYDGNKITIGDCGFVRNATDAVEINLQPTATPLLPFDADPDLCPEVNQQTYLFIDDLETDNSQWSYGIDTGSQHWGYKTIPTHGRDAHSGLGYLYADDTYNSSDSFVMTDPFNIPADVGNGAFLYFYHDLMLDSFSSDQGFVEYRIDGGAWTNTNTLSSLNGYNATTHYTGTSQGYIGTRVDLSTLAASNNVQIRWRLVTDATGIDKGWYLDDVKVYTCSELNFVPAGKYDDNDLKAIGTTLINYTGSWSLTGDFAYYKSTQHSTVQNLATAVLGFYGTKVTVYYSKGTNRGSFKVYIDDVMLDTIEQAHFATETGWVWYSGYIDNDTNPNNELIAANHTIKLEFISAGAGTSGLIDAIEVEDLPEPAVVESGYYDDISKDVIITGNWLRKDPVISAYKSTTHETTDPGARLKLTWFAKRPMLIYPLHPEAGKVDAYLDDVFYARINQKAPDFIAYQGYRWTISPSFDPPSEHTIEFRLAPGQSAGTKMFIDAIVVPAAVRRTAGVYDDHDLGFFFTGQWLAKGGPSSPYFMKARHQTSVGNSMMKNTITGNRVCLIYPGGPDRGQGRVDIDGGYYGSMNEYWPTVRFNMVWCTNELPLSTFGNDEHSVAFFYIAGQPSTLQLFIDGLMIFEKIVVTTNGWYDDRDSELVFTGYWMPSNDPVPGAYLGTIYETKKQNARAKFYFDDGKVTFQYQKGPQGGLVDIYIDGVYETTINQYSASTQQSNQWTMSTSLPAGEHYIELRLAAGQSNKSLYVDAFILGN